MGISGQRSDGRVALAGAAFGERHGVATAAYLALTEKVYVAP